MQIRFGFKDSGITLNRPRILDRMPPRKARFSFNTAFDRATVGDPAMVFSHHIDWFAYVGRLSMGGINIFWNDKSTPYSDWYAVSVYRDRRSA